MTYTDFLASLEKLKNLFGIVPEFIAFQNLEIGISIDTGNIIPIDFLKDEVIDYKITQKNIDTHYGKGYTVSFKLNNYIVKLYDKSMQCALPNNVLRFEIRVKKMVHIKKAEIKTLNDLIEKKKWEWLINLLLETFKDVIICKYDPYAELSLDENNFILNGYNQQFWLRNWTKSEDYKDGSKDVEYKKRRKAYFKMRGCFIKLISQHEFDRNKILFLCKIKDGLANLMTS